MYTKHRWESDRWFNFSYVKYLPADYDETQTYPLVVFLHGAGERGDDLEVACRHGLMKRVREEGKEYPFIYIAPQCPDGKYWGCYTESLLAFLDDMMASLPVDPDRVYLTGLSMGGTGTFMLAMADPDRFAAIAPVCGSGIYWYGGALKNTPTYMVHGDLDDVVPLAESVNMLRSIHRRGGEAELEICYGVGHDAWNIAYGDDRLVNWLLSHKKERD